MMWKLILAITAAITAILPKESKVNVQSAPTVKLNSVGRYSYNYFSVENNQLELYGNWIVRKNLKEQALNNNCISAINGGFYDTDAKPLGLFINSEFKNDISKPSSLINGYIYKNGPDADISTKLPDHPIWAVQTGPILIDNRQTANLNLIDDKAARRTAALKIDNCRNCILFITIYDTSSRLDGPFLHELPYVLSDIGKQQKWIITTAINLDGGSASGYYDQNIYIPELTFVGSFFCNKRLI